MRKSLCYVATISAAVHTFLRPHILAAAPRYDITVICDPTDQHLLVDMPVRLLLTPIRRKPSPVNDLKLLIRLWQIFREERFDIVHSIMPKTGLIAMLAAWLTQVPVRIHMYTGQVWVTRRGISRSVLKSIDRVINFLATCVLSDSISQRNFLIEEGVLPSGRVVVIGQGSHCGVDTARFKPDQHARLMVRDELGIEKNAPVILYVGRLTREKGVLDLASAFMKVVETFPSAQLLIVGAEEDVPFSLIRQTCSRTPDSVHYVSFSVAPERYMAAADVFCLPSYRESFGMTIIEAGACEVPTVASNIYGITDAVADGQTGMLFPPGDVAALARTLCGYLSSDALRHEMGRAARTRVLELFPSDKITRGMVMLYDRLSNTAEAVV